MNTTLPSMKIVSLLTRVAVLTVAVSAFAILFDVYAGLFTGIAASALLLLIAARDYAPRPRRWLPRVAPVRPSPNRHSFRLAA